MIALQVIRLRRRLGVSLATAALLALLAYGETQND